nr:reverse transcriptase domain-containing protein [Tanacetum cinerariifolium]
MKDFLNTIAATLEENMKAVSPITCKVGSTLGDVISTLSLEYVHMIYVDIITLRDFLFHHRTFELLNEARIWLEKEPSRSIFTWDDLVLKFINQFFPISKTTNLRNDCTNFQQCFDESFSEAWEKFKDLLRACHHHGFLKLHQLDTFYNALNSKDQDSLNSAVGGNFLDKMPRECLAIIESKSKVCYSRNKPVVAKVSINTSTSGISPDVAELNDMVKALFLDKKGQNQAPATLKAVEESCVTCGVSATKPNLRPSIPIQITRSEAPRSFLKTGKALIDLFEGKLTLCVGKEAVTFNLDQTSRYSANYNDMTEKQIDVIDMACEEYSQEVLGFSDLIASGNPTPYYDPIVSNTSLTLTPFENSDFLLEEVHAFLALDDDPTSPKVDQSYLESEGDILLLEAFLNDDPSLPPLNQVNYMPEVRKELKICEAKCDKSSIDEPLEVELKDLPPYLKYAFLEGDDKLPVIIAKYLSVEEKTALITVLKSHKRAIAWKLFDIKGIDPKFCTHKTLVEEDFEPAVQHQRRVNLNIHDVIKQEEKSHFMVKEGIVLGYKISKQGIEVDKAKVDVITKLPHPITVKGIRSFLGHVGFYRRFIKDFSKIARPMTRLLEKDTPFIFSKECVEAFQTLKRKLTEAPILIASDWDMPFELMCDASDFSICVVIGQRQDKHFRPIHYASKTMTKVESNYTKTEKEMLVVVYAFEKFRSYLIMNKRIVYADHFALKYLFAKKDSKARLLFWVLHLQEFIFKVIDTKGAENLAADHLS